MTFLRGAIAEPFAMPGVELRRYPIAVRTSKITPLIWDGRSAVTRFDGWLAHSLYKREG